MFPSVSKAIFTPKNSEIFLGINRSGNPLDCSSLISAICSSTERLVFFGCYLTKPWNLNTSGDYALLAYSLAILALVIDKTD